jgi:hypothetical protein
LVAVSALVISASAGADTIAFQQGVSPSAGYTTGGVTIRSDVPTTNQNGGAQFDQIIVGRNTTFSLRGLLEFDLSALEAATGGAAYTINSVTLTLTSFNAGSLATSAVQYDLALLGTNLDFDEATVTWNNAPSVAGGTVGDVLSSVSYNPNTATAARTFGDTAAFRTAVGDALNSDPANTIRFMLKAHDETGSNFTRFGSDESATLAHPSLTIDYSIVTPLPGAAVAGLVLLGGMSFRRPWGGRRW